MLVTITAKVNKPQKKVKLRGDQAAHLQRGDTFVVKDDDTLEWRVQGSGGESNPDLGNSKARVRFVQFPNDSDPRQLLNEGKTVDERSGRVITGTVFKQALPGHYRYEFLLVDPQGTETKLECSWEGVPNDPNPLVTGMGGGVRSGGPH